MNTINGPSQSYQTPSPYAPLGKPAVGLESLENKDQTLPPVEEASASEKNRNQPHQKTDAASGDAQGGNGKKNSRQAAELTEEEQQQVRELAATDREVRAHEAAHQAVGGSLAGAASFRFAIGPDGERYAVGGEVPITLTAIADDSQATLRNAEQVRAAALAPAQPSGQDRQVAAEAAQLIAQTQIQIALQRAAALHSDNTKSSDGAAAVDSFSTAAGHTLAPGSLLDQRS